MRIGTLRKKGSLDNLSAHKRKIGRLARKQEIAFAGPGFYAALRGSKGRGGGVSSRCSLSVSKPCLLDK